MLFGTVLLWAFNATASRYALTHGFKPLVYATFRYFAATALFWAFTWQRERSFRVQRSDLRLIGVAALLIFLNQICFVVAIHETSASTVGLVFGTTPVFVGVVGMLVGFERLDRRFWLGAAVTVVGVGFVAAGTGDVSGSLRGDLIAVATAATWGAYSVAIAPLMRRYSPFLISSLVLALGWVPLALVSIPELSAQSFDGFGTLTWLSLVYGVLGPLFLTNILWFRAIRRVGPARATLFANIQPFFAVLFAIVLLSERLDRWEIVGGVAIAAGIVLERMRGAPATVVVAD
jgi:drug/metabolite transporter (DMT)-like permease